MAIFVSRSGGWMSAMRPHSKRDRRRSSRVGNLAGRTVRGDHDLLLRLVEGVEGVEELLLGPLLAGQELDVVDEEQVHAAVLFLEILRLLEADGIDEFVHEVFGGKVALAELGAVRRQVVPDGVHEVGLAEADSPVDVERVVGHGRLLGDGLGRGVGELVRRAGHEGVEGVAGVQGPRTAARRAAGGGGAGTARRGRGRGAAVGARLEADRQIAGMDLAEDFPDHRKVVAADPLGEEGAGDLHFQRLIGEGSLLGRLQPGVEALAVQLGLNLLKNLFPEFHGSFRLGLAVTG